MKTIKLKKIVIKILKKYGFNNYNAKLIAEILINKNKLRYIRKKQNLLKLINS